MLGVTRGAVPSEAARLDQVGPGAKINWCAHFSIQRKWLSDLREHKERLAHAERTAAYPGFSSPFPEGAQNTRRTHGRSMCAGSPMHLVQASELALLAC